MVRTTTPHELVGSATTVACEYWSLLNELAFQNAASLEPTSWKLTWLPAMPGIKHPVIAVQFDPSVEELARLKLSLAEDPAPATPPKLRMPESALVNVGPPPGMKRDAKPPAKDATAENALLVCLTMDPAK